MRIGWYSNSPDTPTGYGVQTAQVTRRMAADGHEVHVFANYGQIAGIRDWNGVSVWPQGHVQYGLDVVDEQARLANVEVVIGLYDSWVLGDAFRDWRFINWTPVDHYPAPPGVLEWCRKHEVIAMCEYGATTLRRDGVEPVAVIPHAIEDVYRPAASDVRVRMHIPDSAFLVSVNAANIGVTPPRKNWGGNLEALARFLKRHDDTYAYLHTDLARPAGLPIPVLISALGIPKDRIIVVPPVLYRGGLVGDDELARIYSASDVLLATSKGEGFGVPTLEAMGCGTPAIVSDFSASPEVIGDTGWKVPGQLDWDHNQGAFFFTPYTGAIVDALEAAYAERGERAEDRRKACLARADLYRADRVYAEQWRPLLARIEAELHAPPKEERKGMSNAAKRRARKAAKAA